MYVTSQHEGDVVQVFFTAGDTVAKWHKGLVSRVDAKTYAVTVSFTVENEDGKSKTVEEEGLHYLSPHVHLGNDKPTPVSSLMGDDYSLVNPGPST